MHSDAPTSEEITQFSLTAFKGIEVGLGQDDPGVVMAKRLSEKYPDHIVLVQAGKFLHAYDRSAYFLGTLKGYKTALVGTAQNPHLRVGFPVSNFKRRLWAIVAEFNTPYVVAVGSKVMGHTVYVSDQNGMESSLLQSVPDSIVDQVINDLRQRGEVNKAGAKQLLTNPDTSGFKLKSHAQDLDTQIMLDIINMSRDIRTTFGENVRVCMARLMRSVFSFGLHADKMSVLKEISTDLDLLKHYLIQAQKLKQVKIALEHRAALTVELGRLVGGLIRAEKVAL